MGQGPRPPTFMWPWRDRDPNAPLGPAVDTVTPSDIRPGNYDFPELGLRYKSPILRAGGLPTWWESYLQNYPWLPWLLILAAGVVAYRIIRR